MTRKLRSRTGRGLSTATIGEWILLAVCVLYLFTHSVALFVVGMAVAGLVGFSSIVSMWRGQDEFGPIHHRTARRGTYWFLLATLFFILCLGSFSTFPSASLTAGIDESENDGRLHEFKELFPPTILFAIAIAAELVSGSHFLWELVGDARRRWTIAYGTFGVVLGGASIVLGWLQVRTLEAENGLGVNSADSAQYYLGVFLFRWLTVMAVLIALSRVFSLVLLRHAKNKVFEAENEPSPAAEASATMPP